jgi:hypothetical protein
MGTSNQLTTEERGQAVGDRQRGGGRAAYHIVSRHFFRRRARTRAARVDAETQLYNFLVRKAERGPYRWYVVRVTRNYPPVVTNEPVLPEQ